MGELIPEINARRARRALSEKHQESEQNLRVRKPESEVICYNIWGSESPNKQ